jgi:hypothetical protein
VKVKIYSILLLLSFLVFLCHEIIPHQHHDHTTEYSSNNSSNEEKHSHGGKDHFHKSDLDEQHQGEPDEKDEQNHAFPLHHHFLASSDYDFIRLNSKNTISFQASLIQLFLAEKMSSGLLKDFDSRFSKIPEHPPRLKSKFEPGTIGLRAPPCFS